MVCKCFFLSSALLGELPLKGKSYAYQIHGKAHRALDEHGQYIAVYAQRGGENICKQKGDDTAGNAYLKGFAFIPQSVKYGLQEADYRVYLRPGARAGR